MTFQNIPTFIALLTFVILLQAVFVIFLLSLDKEKIDISCVKKMWLYKVNVHKPVTLPKYMSYLYGFGYRQFI